MKKQVRIFSICAALCAAVFSAFAAAPVNPRATDKSGTVRSTAVGALTRNAANTTRTRIAVRPRNGAVVSRAGTTRMAGGVARAISTPVRSTTVARTAAAGKPTNARAATTSAVAKGSVARSAMARATAVFNDISKIGSGYAECRESYSTCMDQMCANANDTYRRCFCSDKFETIRATEERLDQAMLMLQQFQDNNLNAVDKTAAEVNAMYTATVGEEAIKEDASASAELLDNIDKLLKGVSINPGYKSSNESLGILDLDFSASDDEDIWASGGNSIFDSGQTDMSTLQGVALFNAARNQCVRLSQNRCDNDAVFNMTQSSYNILITQDCNAYEKTLNKKRETLAQAIRTAEKYLREARLEEYRTHNSASVNECLAKVRTTMLSEVACGADYKRCLDPTGAYIDTTGEPIYSPRLFELESKMSLNGDLTSDVLGQNAAYNTFFDNNYKKYVERDLDTCRDEADFVWNEFKRIAVIEIAQAQSALLEEVRESCVDTIAECYDTQSSSLVDLAGSEYSSSTAVTAGALSRWTARTQCREKVVACAMLWAPNSNAASCKFDSRGHLENSAATCGLQSLLDYVNAVDSITIADKCTKAIDNYLADLCTPDGKTHKYPYNCRNQGQEDIDGKIGEFASANCESESDDLVGRSDLNNAIEAAKTNFKAAMNDMFQTECIAAKGVWYKADSSVQAPNGSKKSVAFYTNLFARDDSSGVEWGVCYESNDRLRCLDYNAALGADEEDIAIWNTATEQCTFKDAWYKNQCEMIGGYYENAKCYILD